MFVIVNSVNIGNCVQIDIMDYQTKQEYYANVYPGNLNEWTCNLLHSFLNNLIKVKYTSYMATFKHLKKNENVYMQIFKKWPAPFEEIKFVPKITNKNKNDKSNLKEKISEEEIINMDHKQKMHNDLYELKELNTVSKVKTQLIHPDLPSDNVEKQIKLNVPASTNTDEISKFKNEIAELKSYLAGLQDFVPKVVLGIFNDYKITKQKNPYDTHSPIVNHQLIESKIIEFPINVKEIVIPLGQDPNNKLQYNNINLNKLEQFYNLENLTIPSCVFFKEKKFNVSSNSKIINQHYGNLALENLASDYTYREFCNVSDVNLPKLKQLELIGYPKKGVFCFLQPQLEKIIINEHNFDYKLPSNFKSIDEVKIDISEFRLNFICPIILNTSNELDIVLRTQCPKLKLIEFNFYAKSEMSSKYLKKLKKDFCYYYDEEYFIRYGLEVKINIY